jgi:hypothetical protein
LPARARKEFEGIDAMLLDLAVPTDEWDILYRLRLQIERDLLVGAEPGTEFPGHGANSRDHSTASSSTGRPSGAAEPRDREAGQTDKIAHPAVA